MPPWIVVYADALDEWEARARPGQEQLLALLAWLLDIVDAGPPDDALPVPLHEDLYVSLVPDAGVFVTYLALAYERRVVIRRID